MTIFDILKGILYSKSDKLLEDDDFKSEFNPFMSQRWLSMYSPLYARILNATTNKLFSPDIDKDQWYKLFLVSLPKSKFKKINYIKKSYTKKSKPKTGNDAAIKLIAQTKKISEREVRMYIDEYGLDISKIANSMKEK